MYDFETNIPGWCLGQPARITTLRI